MRRADMLRRQRRRLILGTWALVVSGGLLVVLGGGLAQGLGVALWVVGVAVQLIAGLRYFKLPIRYRLKGLATEPSSAS